MSEVPVKKQQNKLVEWKAFVDNAGFVRILKTLEFQESNFKALKVLEFRFQSLKVLDFLLNKIENPVKTNFQESKA